MRPDALWQSRSIASVKSFTAAELWIAREGYRNAMLEIVSYDVGESGAGEANIAA